jgi:hypothetical protein
MGKKRKKSKANYTRCELQSFISRCEAVKKSYEMNKLPSIERRAPRVG